RRSLQLGGSFRYMPVFFVRQDKVVGPMTTPLYELHASSAASISSAARPPTCGPGAGANCLRAADVQRWNELFAAGLGIVDTAGVIAVRDAALKPLPLGTPIRLDSLLKSYEGYANHVWRATPSLTLTTGLLYSIQTPLVDRNGFDSLMTDIATQEILDTRTYLGRRRVAAERGEIYNPTLGWLPIRQ